MSAVSVDGDQLPVLIAERVSRGRDEVEYALVVAVGGGDDACLDGGSVADSLEDEVWSWGRTGRRCGARVRCRARLR